jgi:hypothetical protein
LAADGPVVRIDATPEQRVEEFSLSSNPVEV